jgi:hypothetical protein
MFLEVAALEQPCTASLLHLHKARFRKGFPLSSCQNDILDCVPCGSAGRVTVHPIEDSGREESEATFQVPSPGAPGNVTCMALSAHFLIAGTAAGMLLYYQCQDKALLNEFRHTGGAIVKVFPQPYGTR